MKRDTHNSISTTKDNTYAVILAGGSGTRFWPLSRQIEPKHLLKFYGDESLLQQTIKRIIPLVTPALIYIITNNLHKFELTQQASIFGIPESNIIIEPEGKNTAPAIGLAAVNIIKKDSDPTLIILPADHHIADNKKFISTLKTAVTVAKDNHIVTLGIKPTNPATGYGYIKVNEKLKIKNAKWHKVQKFVEKPDLKKAKKYIKDKNYFWNSGMFIVKAKVILNETKKYLPKLHKELTKIANGEDIQKIYKNLNSISIDYGVLEKSKNSVVIPVFNLGWSDLGTLCALDTLLSKDKNENIVQANSIDIDSRNVIILGQNRLISTIGLKDLIIADTEDALLICHKEKAEDVKKMVEKVKQAGGYEHFSSNTVKRPWGTYTVINKGNGYKVKVIELLAGKRLSLQRHKFRSEHWVVVEGTAKVTCQGKENLVHSNESIFVAPEQLHRLENPANKPLKIVEVQSGSYLEEDDIERLDDDFKR
ncbi:MAG: mannose-1-phosphate guanylyltransferase/mannose-6-phosphate isomerase [Candidatus Omnitrophota bacterium]|nr:mannose-1-phosphate guanylyltransferase/mannose-6-phosphate isomerase [Candidatus Omnitrophota bacterium]